MEWVAPTIAGVFAVLTGSITAFVAIRNVRTGSREQRAPDVTEAWVETERARARMHVAEDFFYMIRGAFKGFARRVMQQHPDVELTDAERTALEVELPRAESER